MQRIIRVQLVDSYQLSHLVVYITLHQTLRFKTQPNDKRRCSMVSELFQGALIQLYQLNRRGGTTKNTNQKDKCCARKADATVVWNAYTIPNNNGGYQKG